MLDLALSSQDASMRVAGLPLHVAAQNGCSVEVFEKLIEAYPGAVSEKNDDGDLAIHIAAANEASEEVMLAIIEADPDVCKQADMGGELPLHTGAYNRASAKVLTSPKYDLPARPAAAHAAALASRALHRCSRG